MSTVADFDPPDLYLAPPQVVIQVEFRGDLWHPKTGLPGVSSGVVCVILRLAVLVGLRLVTDVQTNRQTDGHRAMASTADAEHRAVKMKHCLIFSREIFYVTVVLCLNILRLKAVNEITAGQT